MHAVGNANNKGVLKEFFECYQLYSTAPGRLLLKPCIMDVCIVVINNNNDNNIGRDSAIVKLLCNIPDYILSTHLRSIRPLCLH